MTAFYRIVAPIIMGAVLLSSCSTSTYNEQEEENQQKRELIVGKWACRRPAVYSGYDLYVFRADGTGIGGHYDDPLVTPNPTLYSGTFRYAIFNGEIAFCEDYRNHDHPMTPGTICDSNMPLFFNGFTVDESTLQFNGDYQYPFTRVEQWSDFGLPSILFPEDRWKIVGKWYAWEHTGKKAVYYLYVFRSDGTGIQGQYEDPKTTSEPTLQSNSFRYEILNGQIGICPNSTHTHPMLPGEACEYNQLYFYNLKIKEYDSMVIGNIGNYYYVSQWSDVGLPDDLLPE